ncbi:MAG: sigma-70 family RNA polymerase sigma factor [Leptospiraceae bacterium]|nr:sigma-70 family RNA polymerase sigma factor [Leptospiraceae bacterium]
MNYEHKEKQIQSLYRDHDLNSPEGLEEFLKKFFDLVSDEIYQFPIKIYNFDEDEAGDFYLYAFEQLKTGRKLLQYEGKSRFFTWFFTVLRNLTIDFMRTRGERPRHVFLSHISRDLYLEDESQAEGHRDIAQRDVYQKFENTLQELKLEQRVIFKLIYVNFFEFSVEEVNYLCQVRQEEPEQVMRGIFQLKEEGWRRYSRLRHLEEKLTANFQQIRQLEAKIEAFFQDNPHIKTDKAAWNEYYVHPDIPVDILELIQQLMRRRKRQSQLLKEQQKKLFATKLPIKKIAHFLGVDASPLAVQLGRIQDKLAQILNPHLKKD